MPSKEALQAAVVINNVLSVSGKDFDGPMTQRAAEIIDREFADLRQIAFDLTELFAEVFDIAGEIGLAKRVGELRERVRQMGIRD